MFFLDLLVSELSDTSVKSSLLVDIVVSLFPGKSTANKSTANLLEYCVKWGLDFRRFRSPARKKSGTIEAWHYIEARRIYKS